MGVVVAADSSPPIKGGGSMNIGSCVVPAFLCCGVPLFFVVNF